jgi:hypothetical protein
VLKGKEQLQMFEGFMRWKIGALAATAMLLGATGWQSSAFAGSDNSSDTYAADYSGMGAPTGTFIVFDYTGWRHADEFVLNNNNILGKFGFAKNSNADFSVWTDIERITYFTTLWNHPLILSAAVPIVAVDNHVIGPPPAPPVGGLQSFHDGVSDPAIFITYGLVVDPTIQRYLGFTTYLHIPTNNYRAAAVINTSTDNQWTVIPQVGYSEGLTKFGLTNLWFDFIGNASIHSDGKDPVSLPNGALGIPLPGSQFYTKLTQDNSYDVKAFLRYSFAPSFWVAAGMEKSWGGNQLVSGGGLGTIFGTSSLATDSFLKGHIQASYPLMRDFHIAVDLTHDFETSGNFKEDFTAEVRLTKFFFPVAEPLK